VHCTFAQLVHCWLAATKKLGIQVLNHYVLTLKNVVLCKVAAKRRSASKQGCRMSRYRDSSYIPAGCLVKKCAWHTLSMDLTVRLSNFSNKLSCTYFSKVPNCMNWTVRKSSRTSTCSAKIHLHPFFASQQKFSPGYLSPSPPPVSMIVAVCIYHGSAVRTVTAVCRHWRAIALECPSLWFFISLECPLWTVEEELKRTKGAPFVDASSVSKVTWLNAFGRLTSVRTLHVRGRSAIGRFSRYRPSTEFPPCVFIQHCRKC
jgi:hypothetical protein